jgi:RimJ/RimL family protein N-acetyltransferase
MAAAYLGGRVILYEVTFPERVQTERLVLRRPRPTDGPAFAAIWRDPDVWRGLRPEAPFDPAVAASRFEHHLAHWEEHGFGLWLIELPHDAEIAGWAGAAQPDQVPALAGSVEVGWTLRRRHWGRGLATEAARAAVAAAFEHLDVDELISLIEPSNERSRAVAARLGMRHVRDVPHPLVERIAVYAVSR